MTQDNSVLCYEGVQRVYRNAIVRFLRSALCQAFPADYLDKLRAPFTKEWDEIKQNASAARQSGELTTPITDDFDLLSVNHFFNLFDVHYTLLCHTETGNSDTEKKKQKQVLLSWIRTIKNLRDPLSHPSEEDFSREDSFMLLDNARRVLLRLNLFEDASKVKLLIDKLLGQTSPDLQREPLESQLPPKESIVVDFVCRDIEMRDLWEWFNDPVSRRWALAGEGGKGKSALAYNFAVDVKFKAPQPYQTVFWLTAKKKKFLEGTVIASEPDFIDLDSVFARLLTCYGWIEEVQYPTESKRKRTLELLDEFPALIVVDDVDSLESENEDAIEFFSLDLPKTISKVLFTSRRTIFGMGGTTTHVTGFGERDAEKFILSRCQLMELDPVAFDKKIIQRIVKATEGSPLYIEDLIRFVPYVSTVAEAINLWETRTGNEARRYALGRECELLTANARKILLAASICPHAASFAEIESISGLSADVATAALQELQRLFLIPKPKLIEGEQRFDVNINTKMLVHDVYGTDDTFRRIEEACKIIQEGVPKTGRGAVGAIIRQALFLERADKYQEAEHLLQNALDKFTSNPDLIGVLGKIYKSWQPPRITDAREKFLRAWQLKSTKIEMYEHWCQMEIREQEWTGAATAAEKGLKLLPDNRKLLYLSGYARSRLGKELLGSRHEEKAKKELIHARSLLEKALGIPHDKDFKEMSLDSDIYRALVIVCEVSVDKKNMQYYLNLWKNQHPNDPDAVSECERISRKYGTANP